MDGCKGPALTPQNCHPKNSVLGAKRGPDGMEHGNLDGILSTLPGGSGGLLEKP